jgi:hypothetical protein
VAGISVPDDGIALMEGKACFVRNVVLITETVQNSANPAENR